MSMAETISRGRAGLSDRAMTIYAALTAVGFSATSSAPTPLYHVYQQTMQLSAATVTAIFAAYSFAMLASFLTVAKLSDYVGRKPMILASLLINAVALVLFITAGSAWELILARIVQGVATGIAITSLGAAIMDTDKANGALLNSVTALIGLMVGSLLAGVLVAFAPLPMQLVYIVLLAITLGEAVVLAAMPETTTHKHGGLKALAPHLSVPAAARPVLIKLLPLNVAGWAFGGFYLSLMPTLVAVATGIASPFIGAAVVSAMMLTAAIAVFALRHVAAERLLLTAMLGLLAGIAVTLGSVYLQSVPLMFLGTVIAGVGFGSAYSGNLRAILPLAGAHERAGLLATYFVESYIAFSVPAVIAGLLAPTLGLVTTTYYYGAVLIVLIVISLLATQQRRPQRQMEI
jgi:MFS family permease